VVPDGTSLVATFAAYGVEKKKKKLIEKHYERLSESAYIRGRKAKRPTTKKKM
jgi:hypothetical protein